MSCFALFSEIRDENLNLMEWKCDLNLFWISMGEWVGNSVGILKEVVGRSYPKLIIWLSSFA